MSTWMLFFEDSADFFFFSNFSPFVTKRVMITW